MESEELSMRMFIALEGMLVSSQIVLSYFLKITNIVSKYILFLKVSLIVLERFQFIVEIKDYHKITTLCNGNIFI